MGFIAALMGATSLQSVVCAVIYAVRGKEAAAKAGARMLNGFNRLMSPLFWGPFRVENAELLPPGDEACLYIGNHTSTVDTVGISFLPNRPHVAAVGKDSIMIVPGIGFMVGLCGGIYIRRGKKGALAGLIESGTERLKRGISVGIFPQGTRKVCRLDKPFPPFKRGAFVLADKTRARIVPITFLYPSDFMSAKPAVPGIRLVVHPSVLPKGDGDVDGLMQSVEATINAPLRAMLEEEAKARESN